MGKIDNFETFDDKTKITLLHNRSAEHAKRLQILEQSTTQIVASLNQIKWMMVGGGIVFMSDKMGLLKALLTVF